MEFGQKGGKILAGEGPLKGNGDLLLAVWKSEQTLFHFWERGKVMGRKDLALHDGEVDFDLIPPTRVQGRVDQDHGRPLGAQSSGGFGAAGSRAVVQDPEKTRRADRYGSGLLTWAPQRFTGPIPFLASQRANSLARWTSPAARELQAPARWYSCSTRRGQPGEGGQEGCWRRRAGRLVFSSAEMTNSVACNGLRFQRLSYRSRMRPAFSAKSGSRGKIQRRGRQGQRASARSQRHRGVPRISATMPCWRTSRGISERDSRERGNPRR